MWWVCMLRAWGVLSMLVILMESVDTAFLPSQTSVLSILVMCAMVTALRAPLDFATTAPLIAMVNVTVSVVPTEANVMVGQAVCRVGEGVHAIIPDPVITTRLSAIGKYAYISVSDPALKWGEVLTGTSSLSTKKELVLRNTSVVPAEFRLIRHETDSDEVFDVQPREGVVPPQSEILVTASPNLQRTPAPESCSALKP